MAELNYPFASPGRTPIALPLDAMINATLAQSAPIQRLNATLWLWWGNNFPSWDCFHLDQTGTQGVPLIQTEVFDYINCNKSLSRYMSIPSNR